MENAALAEMDEEIKKFGLFATRRFLPIFLCQFLGAFNDNLLRSGLVVLIAYSAEQGLSLPLDAKLLVTICSALLVLPFIFFSGIAGPLADKYDKSMLVRIIKGVEVAIMLGAAYGFAMQNVALLMVLLFVSGTHSTFFGPIKYSILPDHVKKGELLAANGFISGSTYLGILLGLITGGLIAPLPGNVIGITAVCVALTGLAASLLIPRTRAADPGLHVSLNLVGSTMRLVRVARQDRKAFYAIVGLSWFLLIGSVFMAQFPNYAQSVVHANNQVYTLFLSIFSIGIAVGSLLCDRLLKGQISAKLVPITLLGVTIFTLGMVMTTPTPTHEGLLTFSEFIADSRHWPLLFFMLMVSVCGGIYIVPLYAIMQHNTPASERSSIMAASNLFDSIFMTTAAVAAVLLLAAGVSITQLFLIIAVLNLGVFAYARTLLKGNARASA